MKFPDSFLDEIRARLPVSQVVSRRVPLKRAGREWKGLSPFNKEKTPSFTVNDQKGFYHCFSSGKHGDIFGFLMETEGVSFPEAVERLAGDAGVPMPKPDPQFERVARERLGLRDAVEAVAVYFEEQLRTAEGREALAYAQARGLSPATLKEFRIGYAPQSRETLKTALLKKGFTEAQLLEAGLLIKPDDGRPSYDRFRKRLTIPITDTRGHVIAFGARALDSASEPKYLNSPETKLFDKGSTVFNFARARKGAFDRGEVIVVEGYMDVIALHQAGFDNVVATLGTAFTERQMEQLWLLAPEPIVCFDGDKAGEAAAARAIDRMLPTLREGHSFRFAFLPQGSDPDDLVRNEGKGALAAILNGASPLIDVVWQRERQASPIDTPERRAALEERLEHLIAEIGAARVKDHYRKEIRNRLFALWRELGTRQPRPGKTQGTSQATRPPSSYGFVTTIILCLLRHPWLLDHFAEEVASLHIKQRALAELLSLMTRCIFDHPGITPDSLAEALKATTHAKLVEKLSTDSAFMRLSFLQADTPRAEVEEAFSDLLFRWNALPTLQREIEEMADQLSEASEAEFEQFAMLQQQLANNGVRHTDNTDDSEYARRFQETIARLKAENIGGHRGRRSQRQAD
ncbi:MAG: DNA primase [Methyloceanibacter sp.]|uniref:DNA primase n=1 Tax=Methyloceanibacter sp. TaxID=1965321 RepID=UPI003D9BFB1D